MAHNIFVGRSTELDILNNIFNKTYQGLGKVVFVEGEPGSGKTALIRQFITMCHKQKEIASAVSECTDKEGLNAYSTFKDLLLELNINAAGNNSGDRRNLKNKLKGFIAETGPKWIGMIPVIGEIAVTGIETAQALQKYFGNEEPQNAGSEKEIFEIIDSELRRLAAKMPLVIFIDDLQWSDNASLNLLFSLCLSIRRKPFPVMIIGSYRPYEIKTGRNKISDTGENITIRHPFADKLNELRNYTKKESHIERTDQWFYEINIPPLADDEIELLVKEKFPENQFPEHFVTKLKTVTEGHALFVNEILESLVTNGHIFSANGIWQISEAEIAELPVSVNGVIAERIGRLNKESRKVLDYAGVCGENFSIQVVEQVLKIDELDLLDYMQELSEKHGLVVSGELQQLQDMFFDLYKFTHALVRKYVYENQESARRRALHRRIAQVMQELYGKNLDKDAQAKLLYEQHKRIGSGVIDGVDFKFSKETVQKEEKSSVIDFALEEFDSAQKAFDEFAVEECNQRIDRSLAFINQISGTEGEAVEIRFKALLLRAENQQRAGLYKEALTSCQVVLPIAQLTNKPEFIARACKQTGKVLHYLARYEKAIEQYRQALAIYTSLDIKQEIADCYNQIGFTYTYMGIYEPARENLDKALEINRQLNAIDKIADTLINIGTCCRFKGDYINAKPFYDQALQLSLAFNRKQLIALAYNNIGLTTSGLGHHTDSIGYYEKALQIDKELNDKVNMANHMSNIGLAHDNQGNYDKAIEFYSQSLAIDERLDDEVKMAVSYNNIGSVYMSKGDYNKALEYFQKALDINKKNKDKIALAHSYVNLGNLYYTTEDFDKSQEYHELSMNISLELGDEAATATDYNNIGNVHYARGDYDKAFEYYQKTYTIYEKFGNRVLLSLALNNMANIRYMQDKNEEALSYYKKALEIAKEFDDSISLSRTYANMASNYIDMEEPENVISCIEKAIEIDRQLNDEVNLSGHLQRYAKFLYDIRDFDKASQCFTETAELYEKLRLDDSELIHSIRSLGLIAEMQTEYKKALKYYSRAYNKAKEYGYEEDAAFIANDISDCYEKSDDFVKGKEWRDIAVGYYLSAEDYANVAVSYQKTAETYSNKQEYQKSLEINLNYVLPNYEKIEDMASVGSICNRIGNCYLTIPDYNEAEKYYHKSMQIFSGKDSGWEAIVNYNLGIVESRREKYSEAISYFEVSQNLYNQIKAYGDAAECMFRIGRLYVFLENIEKGLEIINEALFKYKENEMDCSEIEEFVSQLRGDSRDPGGQPGNDKDLPPSSGCN